jgi:hypothetical protein
VELWSVGGCAQTGTLQLSPQIRARVRIEFFREFVLRGELDEGIDPHSAGRVEVSRRCAELAPDLV